MKSKISGSIILVFGIFFVIVGLVLYIPANDTIEKYDSYGIISDIGKVLDPDLEKEYTIAKTMSTIGMIAFIVGLLLTIAGIVFVATGKDAKNIILKHIDKDMIAKKFNYLLQFKSFR